ncbi:hypothetical protein GCM10017643_39030 [Ancylobacter dichloromethanicus]|uniref:Uncharacterized protein n=1 Tax=Ancylobacter dichloromethanicus TaxID=518825 RepID=A0A9W6JA77_9HYPH|nr:hypothetical protein GCM10017643_39030 [Ancylobacter dichloromethanicus]
MGMESPDTRREADDSYRARSAGRSICPTGPAAPTEGVTMGKLPNSLSIAIWLVGSLWIVGYIAYLSDAPGEIVLATFVMGLVAGAIELAAAKSR